MSECVTDRKRESMRVPASMALCECVREWDLCVCRCRSVFRCESEKQPQTKLNIKPPRALLFKDLCSSVFGLYSTNLVVQKLDSTGREEGKC